MYYCNVCQRWNRLKLNDLNQCDKCNYRSHHFLGDKCCQCVLGNIAPKEYITGSLIHAVRAFKKDNEGRWETYYQAVGMCMVVPHTFRKVCDIMKVNCEVKHVGDSINFWHEFNICNGIVIDWTYRQFDENCPIPLIQRVRDYKFLKGIL
jgi:hypothetical protein